MNVPVRASIFLVLISGLLFSFKEKVLHPQNFCDVGVFTYIVNGKVFTIDNMKASMRNTTSGRKELSLSNDRFVKFFFINPSTKNFDLATQQQTKEAIVRYNEPGTNLIYSPKAGHVTITNLNETDKMLTGEFEMELIMPGKDKVIKISKGQFNCPIVYLR